MIELVLLKTALNLNYMSPFARPLYSSDNFEGGSHNKADIAQGHLYPYFFIKFKLRIFKHFKCFICVS